MTTAGAVGQFDDRMVEPISHHAGGTQTDAIHHELLIDGFAFQRGLTAVGPARQRRTGVVPIGDDQNDSTTGLVRQRREASPHRAPERRAAARPELFFYEAG